MRLLNSENDFIARIIFVIYSQLIHNLTNKSSFQGQKRQLFHDLTNKALYQGQIYLGSKTYSGSKNGRRGKKPKTHTARVMT